MYPKLTIEIPYYEHSKYLAFVLEVNSLAEKNGISALFINNNPYHLKCYYVVETAEHCAEILALIKGFNLKECIEFGFLELQKDALLNRSYNVFSLSGNSEIAEKQYTGGFAFADEPTLLERGFKGGAQSV